MAADARLSFPELIETLSDYLDNEEHVTLPFDTPDIDVEELWDSFEFVTGRKVTTDERNTPFSCAC